MLCNTCRFLPLKELFKMCYIRMMYFHNTGSKVLTDAFVCCVMPKVWENCVENS